MNDLDKDCNNCAHYDLTYTQEPCTSCIALPGFSKWEPQPPICTPAERALLDALALVVTYNGDVDSTEVYDEITLFFTDDLYGSSAPGALLSLIDASRCSCGEIVTNENRRTCPDCGSENAHERTDGALCCWCHGEEV